MSVETGADDMQDQVEEGSEGCHVPPVLSLSTVNILLQKHQVMERAVHKPQ